MDIGNDVGKHVQPYSISAATEGVGSVSVNRFLSSLQCPEEASVRTGNPHLARHWLVVCVMEGLPTNRADLGMRSLDPTPKFSI
jgi:hypothetical protein